MVDEIKFRIDVKVVEDKKLKKKKNFASSVNKTELEKTEDTKKISDAIGPKVLTNMLMSYPEIALGVGIGIWSGFKSIFENIFESIFNVDEGTSTAEAPSATITEPEPYQEPSEVSLDVPTVNTEEINLEKPAMISSDGTSYDMEYSTHISFTDNADEVKDHLRQINSERIDDGVTVWKDAFTTTAQEEKTIVKDNLTDPLEELNKVIKLVISNKERVEQLKIDISDYESRIKKKKLAKHRRSLSRAFNDTTAVKLARGAYNAFTAPSRYINDKVQKQNTVSKRPKPYEQSSKYNYLTKYGVSEWH